MTDISYTDIISSIEIDDPTRRSQIENILSQIQSTAEGQSMFQRIQQYSGTIKFTNDTSKNSVYDPGAIGERYVNINWGQLGTVRSFFATDFFGDNYKGASLNRTIVHELFHAADAHSHDYAVGTQESSSIYFTNQYMDKYYSEDYRRGHDNNKQNQPFEEVPYHENMSPNPDYEMRGWGGDKMEGIFYDPTKKSWLDNIQDLFTGDAEHDKKILDMFERFNEEISPQEGYYLSDFVENALDAAESLANFVTDQVKSAVEWFAADDGLQLDFANWFAGNVEDIIDGNLDADEALIDFAKYVALNRLGEEIQDILSVDDAQNVLGDALTGFGLDSEQAAVLASSIQQTFQRLAVEFVSNGFELSAEQAKDVAVGAVAANDNGFENLRQVV